MTIQTLYNTTIGKMGLLVVMGSIGFMTCVAPVYAATPAKPTPPPTPATNDSCVGVSTSTNPLKDGTQCTIGATNATKAGNVLFGDDGIFNKVVIILLFLVGAVSVIMLIVGGFRYVISAGDQNAVTGAKNTILYAIIGLVISFIAFGAVNFLVSSLSP